MNALFLQVVNLSLAAGWMVLAVLLLRALLKKAPKWVRGVLWGLVALRLVLPFSVESRWSLLPSGETIPREMLHMPTPEIQSGVTVVNQTVDPALAQTVSTTGEGGTSLLRNVTSVASVIWLVGVAAMLIYALVSYLRVRRTVQEGVPLGEAVWLCDRVETPFLLGIARPRIYLPSTMAEEDMPYVLAHEKAHLKRKDHIWKPLGFLLLSVYWFHPLLWVAYWLMCKDIELACDEKVIRELGEESKKPYSHALINCSAPRKLAAACPLAFGEVGVKERVKSVLSYKKPAFWVIVIAVAACVIAAVCFLTKPVSAQLPEGMEPFLDEVIAEHHRSPQTTGYPCMDYEILRVEEQRDTVTIYAWVLYEEYSSDGAELHLEIGAHTPTVITAQKNGDRQYRLVEYWTPRDGSYYSKDIRAKFPVRLWIQAMDSEKWIDGQKERNQAKARAHFDTQPRWEGTGLAYFAYNMSLLTLNPEKREFMFAYSPLSSYIAAGSYEEQGDLLVLCDEDARNIYTFRTDGEQLVFMAEESSEMPWYRHESGPCVPDGAVFEKAEQRNTES